MKSFKGFSLIAFLFVCLVSCGKAQNGQNANSKNAISFNTGNQGRAQWVPSSQFSELNCTHFELNRRWKRSRSLPSISVQQNTNSTSSFTGTVQLEKADATSGSSQQIFDIQFTPATCVVAMKERNLSDYQYFLITRIMISDQNQFSLAPCDDQSCKQVNLTESVSWKEHLVIAATADHPEYDLDANPACPDLNLLGTWKEITPTQVPANSPTVVILSSTLEKSGKNLLGTDDTFDYSKNLMARLQYSWKLNPQTCILDKQYSKYSVQENGQWVTHLLTVTDEHFMIVQSSIDSNHVRQVNWVTCTSDRCTALKQPFLTKMSSQIP